MDPTKTLAIRKANRISIRSHALLLRFTPHTTNFCYAVTTCAQVEAVKLLAFTYEEKVIPLSG